MKRFKYLALATLVAFAACDEGTDVIVTPPVTGQIAGTVTIEGTAIPGVTVVLAGASTATAITDGSGAYLFTGLPAGSYAITLTEGFPQDAAFVNFTKAAVITTSGQLATVNFEGSFIRTSSVLGSVVVGGVGIDGLVVNVAGSQVTTHDGGQFGFTGLRAGTYTVTLNFDDHLYAFPFSSQDVTLDVGQSKLVTFTGQFLSTASISGTLYLDGNLNREWDAGEPPVAKAGIMIAIEVAINDTVWAMTDANGMYSKADLAEGQYKVICCVQGGIPGAYTQAAGDERHAVSVGAGTNLPVNFAFDVTTQYVQVYGMLGQDNVNAGQAPIKNWVVNLYPTEVDATAGTNALLTAGSIKTNSAGLATFKFLRKNDYSPNAAEVDGIVFAKVSAPGAGYTLNGENIIEIPWLPGDSMVMAPDTFDATLGSVVVAFKAQEVDLDPAAGWNVALRSNKDSTSALTSHGITDSDGMVYYTVTPATSIALGGDGIFPDTFWVRLSTAQTANNLHAFSSTVAGDEGATKARYVWYEWWGTNPPSDTVMMGTATITYKDADIIYRAHHEADDSTGVTPTYTLLDNFTEVGNVSVKILNADNTLARGSTALTAVGGPASMGPGSDRKYNLVTGLTYKAVATSAWAKLSIISTDTVSFSLAGGNQVDTLDVLAGGAGASTFAYKMDNGTVTGSVLARDGTPAGGLMVHVMAGPGNITGTKDTMVVTDVAGAYTTLPNLREGPYTISVADSTTSGGPIWSFSETLTTTTTPVAGSGAKNADERTGVRDLEGGAAVRVANFLPDRMDTKILGVVVNDRDQDGTDLDPNEALAGAQIQLYRDNVDEPGAGDFGRDTLVATYTTDVNGAYQFTGLREGRYMVRWVAGTPATPALDVLRSLTADSVIVNTAATSVGAGADNTRVVGDTIAFPRWDYSASTGVVPLADPAHFMFLFKNTIARGTLKDAGAVALPGVTVQARRCNVSAGAVSPPSAIAQTCGTYLGATILTTTSDAAGAFSFNGLTEGVYEIRPLPGVGGSAPTSTLFVLVGSGDIESFNFVIS